MTKAWRRAVVVAVVALAGVVVALKRSAAPPAVPEVSAGTGAAGSAVTPVAVTGLPRLVDLGADRCIPCKAMAPILEELRAQYTGRMTVEFIDVWKNPEAGKTYGVEIIPTQIFFGADGKELRRHQGFIPKADIVAAWKELGYDLERPTTQAAWAQ